MSDVLVGAEQRGIGRVVIYSVESGRPFERGLEQAAEMVRSGQFRVGKEAQASVPGPERTADTDELANRPAASVAPSAEPKPRRKQGR